MMPSRRGKFEVETELSNLMLHWEIVDVEIHNHGPRTLFKHIVHYKTTEFQGMVELTFHEHANFEILHEDREELLHKIKRKHSLTVLDEAFPALHWENKS